MVSVYDIHWGSAHHSGAQAKRGRRMQFEAMVENENEGRRTGERTKKAQEGATENEGRDT